MSNRELVIDLVTKLPDDTPLEEIARQIRQCLGINEEKHGNGVSAEEAKQLQRDQPSS